MLRCAMKGRDKKATQVSHTCGRTRAMTQTQLTTHEPTYPTIHLLCILASAYPTSAPLNLLLFSHRTQFYNLSHIIDKTPHSHSHTWFLCSTLAPAAMSSRRQPSWPSSLATMAAVSPSYTDAHPDTQTFINI